MIDVQIVPHIFPSNDIRCRSEIIISNRPTIAWHSIDVLTYLSLNLGYESRKPRKRARSGAQEIVNRIPTVFTKRKDYYQTKFLVDVATGGN